MDPMQMQQMQMQQQGMMGGGMMGGGMMQPGMQQGMMGGGMQQGMMQPDMMQQGMMMAGGMMGGGMMGAPMQQPMMFRDGWTILSGMESMEVNEKIRWGEVLSELFIGVEIDFANQYMAVDPNSKQDLFLLAEETDFCTRQMKRGNCADCVGWKMDVITVEGGQKTKFLHMERDHKCVFLCFNRPRVEISDAASGQSIGSIEDPFACCDLTFKLRGPDEEVVMTATGGCCQWGLCCPLPCGPCAEVNFDINDVKSGNVVGHIKKQVPGCFKFLVDDQVDNYKVEFGQVSHPQWKAMVMVLAVFIDFRYFSETQDPSDIGEGPLGGGLVGAMMD